MRATSRLILRTVTLLLGAASLLPAQGAPGDSAIRRWITERVSNGYATGIVAAYRDGSQTHTFAAGGTEQSGKPLSAESYFEIGSITKVFTNILLADMVLKGEVALDDPVQKFLPAGVTMPSRDGKVITLLDLATASSGLPSLPTNMKPADMANPYADYTVSQLYSYLSSYTLPRAPGARYEYSNTGMGLLGHVLGLRAGKPYFTLLRERVLQPLGMNDTWIAIPADRASRVAMPHNADLEPDHAWDLPTFEGAGALRSTTSDMLKFADAVTHRDRGPLAKAIAFSIEPRRPTTIPNMRIALGWHVREKDGRQIVWHNGGTGGFRTFFGFDPASGANSMVWSNTAASVDDIGLRMIDSTVPLRPTPKLATVSVPDATLQSYVGEYAFAPTFAVTISATNGALRAQATGQPRFKLWPESESTFTARIAPLRISFERGADGSMTLVLDQNGMKQRAVRR
jgi:serine-type D-Ala-D-Ala carboxypeptidase/endopeptidase